jgi:hypothetical protein
MAESLSINTGKHKFRDAFAEDRNPFWVWTEIAHCIQDKEAFPEWVLRYLDDCARRMIGPDRRTSSDTRELLPHIFGFELTGGRGQPLKIIDEIGDKELLAMAFARAILEGKSPKEARDYALNTLAGGKDDMDDTTVLDHLKKFFKMKHAPRGNLAWKKIVVSYFLQDPAYVFSGRFDLPDMAKLLEIGVDLLRKK